MVKFFLMKNISIASISIAKLSVHLATLSKSIPVGCHMKPIEGLQVCTIRLFRAFENI